MKKDEIFYALLCGKTIIAAYRIRTKKETRKTEKEWQVDFCPKKHKIQKCRIVLLNK